MIRYSLLCNRPFSWVENVGGPVYSGSTVMRIQPEEIWGLIKNLFRVGVKIEHPAWELFLLHRVFARTAPNHRDWDRWPRFGQEERGELL
jgi:hypothetical protein